MSEWQANLPYIHDAAPPLLNCFFEYTREAEKNELPNPKTLNPKPKVGRSQVLAALDAGSSAATKSLAVPT